MNTTSKSNSQGLAGLTCKVPVLLLTALLAACGGGGGGSDNGGGSSNSSSSGGSSSSSSSGGSSSSSSSSGGGETAPDQPTLIMEPQATKTFQFSWEPVNGANEYRLLENPDGVSGYEQIATIDGAASEFGLVVFLPEKVNASYILQACNSVGCSDSEAVNVELPELTGAIGYLKAPNPDDRDDFGAAVALSADGSTLAIGARYDDGVDNNATDIGAVYVFTQDQGNWRQQDYLQAPDPGERDYFGTTVSLSADGNTLAVGAYGEDSASIDNPSDNSADNTGAAYVFTRTSDAWGNPAYLKASNIGQDDYFGSSLALSSDGLTLAISADGEDGSPTSTGSVDGDNDDAPGLGAVYVFTFRDGTWQQQQYLKPSTYSSGDSGFGFTLSFSTDGSTLAVGMPFESGFNRGAAYVFTHSGDIWQQDGYLRAPARDTNDNFGVSMALSGDGNTLAIGAERDDSGIAGDSTDNSATDSGAVYIFRRESGSWSQSDFLKADNTEAGDYFGYYNGVALSADGNTLAVTAGGESSAAKGINGDQQDNNAAWSGAVYILKYADGEWRQQSYLKAPNTDTGDEFGTYLALSANGSVLAVGARYESSSGEQDDNSATDAGAVYLY